MKELNGQELVGFIKERQAKQVRALRQAHGIFPRLAIVRTSESPVIATYVRLKQRYGEDILIEVTDHVVTDDTIRQTIDELNRDETVHGIIVQLPLEPQAMTNEILARVAPEKDVDGLGPNSPFDAATPTAINWLLAGHGVDLREHSAAIVGQGRLVGAPLARMWQQSGIMATCFDETTGLDGLKNHSLIVTATGQPGLITSSMVQIGAVVVDGGTASENGKVVGDVAEDVRERDDVTITPQKGGVGPLTVAALFDNVITAASKSRK